MKYLLLLIGLVALQFTTSYCCFENCKDDDDLLISNMVLEDVPMVNSIIKYKDNSFWVYKEVNSGKIDTITLIAYKEELRQEFGAEYNIEYSKKVATLTSSLTSKQYDLGILRPVPDNYIYLRPILFKGKASLPGQNDIVEEIMYFYHPQANIQEQKIDFEDNKGIATSKILNSLTIGSTTYESVTRIIVTKYAGTPDEEINKYYYSADFGLIRYTNSKGEDWELTSQAIEKRQDV